MIEDDAQLTHYGEMMLAPLDECEFCSRSMISRFGGLIGTNQCSDCEREFELLNRAGKITWEVV